MGINYKNEKLRSRHVAFEILLYVHKGYSLKEAFSGQNFAALPDEAKPFTKFLVTQTMRYQNVFLMIFKEYLQKKPQNKSIKFVYTILSMGCCELLLSQQKTNITLSSYTEITKIDKKTNHLSGIIRAVLGKIDANKEAIIQQYLTDYQNIFGSELYNHLKAHYPETITELCQALLQEPVTDILKLQDVPTPSGYQALLPNLMRYENGRRPENLGIFVDGEITIQSFASHLPIYCMGDIKGKKLLDLCAAPGGKTLQAIASGADVTAVDISAKRLEKLHENLKRTGLKANIIQSDVLEFSLDTTDNDPNANKDKFDIILLDAPCTATGTIRKNPDIIQNFSLDKMKKLQDLQAKMLHYASTLLKENGVLIYAVCSLSPQEGEQQIFKFLESNPKFSVIEPPCVAGLDPQIIDSNKFVRLLPYHTPDQGGQDGFFVAYLKK